MSVECRNKNLYEIDRKPDNNRLEIDRMSVPKLIEIGT